MRHLLHRVFLGPKATFRNANRTWLYLGFIALVLVVLTLAALKST